MCGILSQQSAMYVAPFTGAWIEICWPRPSVATVRVAPFTGAWIEMPMQKEHHMTDPVAPFTGAWIEIWGCVRRCGR